MIIINKTAIVAIVVTKIKKACRCNYAMNMNMNNYSAKAHCMAMNAPKFVIIAKEISNHGHLKGYITLIELIFQLYLLPIEYSGYIAYYPL